MVELDRDDCVRLAEALGDEWPMSAYVLRSGAGRAFVHGDPGSFIAAAVEEEPTELAGYGDIDALAELIENVSGWSCVEVDTADAGVLGPLLECRMHVSVHYLDSIWYELTTSPVDISHPWVRELTSADRDIVRTADPRITKRLPGAVDCPERIIDSGVSAGAIHDGRLVSVAASVAQTDTHAEIVVVTLEEYQNQGLAAAATALVARRLRADNRVPQWRSGAPNRASRRVAAKVGFTEMRRRRYVVLDN